MTRSRTSAEPGRPFAALAAHLISLRRTARLTQRALAERASISRGAVQRAESGVAAPCPTVLDAYLRACAAGPAEQARARLLRNRGRAAQRDRLSQLSAPSPVLIRTADDLGAALAAAYERAGAPPLRDLNRPGRAPVPPTTAWRIVNRKGLPATVRQMLTFLTACSISPAEQRLYIDAYHRVTADRPARPAPPRTVIHRTHRVPLSHGGSDDRCELTGTAATIARRLPPAVLEEVFTAGLYEWAGRQAHRNGTTPDLVAATTLIGHGIDLARVNDIVVLPATADGHGADLITRTPDGRTTALQFKRHRPRPPRAPEGLPRATPPSRPPNAPTGTKAFHHPALQPAEQAQRAC
ncbi:helix-turn-helix domain-containing protein [Streptomyces bottropensis]|uniref:helix-turn-helix domain-containing protein n=1 Tax=Streptomyces bottropensis TaxID=42235 RepID=UPI003691814C